MDLKKIKEMPPILIFCISVHFSPISRKLLTFHLLYFRLPRLYAVEMRYFP